MLEAAYAEELAWAGERTVPWWEVARGGVGVVNVEGNAGSARGNHGPGRDAAGSMMIVPVRGTNVLLVRVTLTDDALITAAVEQIDVRSLVGSIATESCHSFATNDERKIQHTEGLQAIGDIKPQFTVPTI